MAKIKHSKLKNTGILFELLAKQITSDTLSGNDSPSIDLLKKYFFKTELGKEYKLYEALTTRRNLQDKNASLYLSTVLDSSKNLNRSLLKKQKYNLIKEIKEKYNIDHFFKNKVGNYKLLASIYTLLEGQQLNNPSDIDQIWSSKQTLMEHITTSPSIGKGDDVVLKEFKTYDKGLRILTTKLLLDKFNEDHDSLNSPQKAILKEYINITDSTPRLREFYNSKINELQEGLKKHTPKLSNPAIKIKLQEISKYITPLSKSDKINDNHLVDLLQYCDLFEEVKKLP